MRYEIVKIDDDRFPAPAYRSAAPVPREVWDVATGWAGWSPWAYWADDTVTEARLIKERPRTIGPVAVGLINLVWGGHGAPGCGWALLVRVAEVRAREEIASVQGRGHCLRDTVERLRVVLVDGEERDLWMRKADYSQSVGCDIHGERPAGWCLNRRGVLEPWRS